MKRAELSEEQKYAIDKMKMGKNVFLSGSGGTGKSLVIREFLAWAREKKYIVVTTAPTSVAACNNNGKTLHSIIKCLQDTPINSMNIASKAEQLMAADVIIVDEISILGKAMFDKLSKCIEYVQEKRGRTIQLICIGDYYQLPPVNDEHTFESDYWQRYQFENVFLTKSFRQSDEKFFDALSKIREGNASAIGYILENCSKSPIEGAVTLCAFRKTMQAINADCLKKLPGDSVIYEAFCDDEVFENEIQAERKLEVKIGARVIITLNDPQGWYYNGSMGEIVELGRDYIAVLLDAKGYIVYIGRHQFLVDSKKRKGKTAVFIQFPILLAYACTIHKAQGMSLAAVNIDAPYYPSAGQAYVALSRATDISKVYIKYGLKEKDVRADPRVKDFYKGIITLWAA